MKKEYRSPELKARKLHIVCMLETSEINVGGNTDHFDAKESSIFDRFGSEDTEE